MVKGKPAQPELSITIENPDKQKNLEMSDSLDSSEQAENSCRVVESGKTRARCKHACVQSSANKILDRYTY